LHRAYWCGGTFTAPYKTRPAAKKRVENLPTAAVVVEGCFFAAMVDGPFMLTADLARDTTLLEFGELNVHRDEAPSFV